MATEDLTGAGKFIDDLVATNPASSDLVSSGDEHLRGVKNVLKNSFGAVTGAVTATHAELNILDGVTSTAAELNILDGVTASTTELNYVDGVTSAIQTQIDNSGIDGITSASSSGTAINITSGNLVGIGTATPNSYYSGYDDLVIKTSGHTGMTIVAGTSSNSAIAFADGTTAPQGYEGELVYNHSSNEFSLGTAGHRRLVIDYSGRVTMPSQPAFNANGASSVTVPVNTWTKFPFPSETFDLNSNWNTSTATFTAPITGKYQFGFSTRLHNLDSSASYYQFSFNTSNKRYNFGLISPAQLFSSDISYWPAMNSLLVEMDANDTLIVEIYQSTGTAQTVIQPSETYISGYLVA